VKGEKGGSRSWRAGGGGACGSRLIFLEGLVLHALLEVSSSPAGGVCSH
jgi:hypothetical protein